VAIGVALTALTLGLSATWWVGTTVMLPYVLIGGLLIVRKTLRSDLVYSFLIVALFTIIAPKFVLDVGILSSVLKIFTNTPLVFFACIMLTEPFTTPPTARLQMVYGVIVGIALYKEYALRVESALLDLRDYFVQYGILQP
jgi:Na+-translocating ferredoxin:NAD+ oxidoreductase RnfD subunit